MATKEQAADVMEAIGVMLAGFPSSQASIGELTIRGYLKAIEDRHPRSVIMACESLLKGEISGFDGNFAPTAAKLNEVSKMFDALNVKSGRPNLKLVSYPIGSEAPKGSKPLEFRKG